jgi:hypothetical protein
MNQPDFNRLLNKPIILARSIPRSEDSFATILYVVNFQSKLRGMSPAIIGAGIEPPQRLPREPRVLGY